MRDRPLSTTHSRAGRAGRRQRRAKSSSIPKSNRTRLRIELACVRRSLRRFGGPKSIDASTALAKWRFLWVKYALKLAEERLLALTFRPGSDTISGDNERGPERSFALSLTLTTGAPTDSRNIPQTIKPWRSLMSKEFEKLEALLYLSRPSERDPQVDRDEAAKLAARWSWLVRRTRQRQEVQSRLPRGATP
jgi:hypothetical protein